MCNDTVFLVCRMGGGTAMSAEYIVNGDFETGDLTGWTVDVYNVGLDTWLINDGTVEIPFPSDGIFCASDPISGNYDAISDYTEYGQFGLPASILFQQTVTLPSNISSATLSWKDRIYSYVPFDEVSEQFFAVYIEYYSGFARFFTSEGDPIQLGPNSRSITEVEVDGVMLSLTEVFQSLEGQEVEIGFVVLATLGPLFATVDDISLDIDTVLPVEIDIKPGSEPNCFNNDGHGVIPVAILGSEDFDVTTIDAGSVMLEGLAVKAVGKSNKLLAHYEDVDSDGYDDLVVQIEDDDLIFEEGDTTAMVTGNLNNGMPIQGSDSICIVP